MEKIFSSVQPDRLLHVILDIADLKDARADLSSDKEYLQVSALALPAGKEVRPHRHKDCSRPGGATQESIVVVSGSLEASYFDLDSRPLSTRVLRAGACTVTFGGGHAFRSLSEDTRFFEFKNGPYLGRDADREDIR